FDSPPPAAPEPAAPESAAPELTASEPAAPELALDPEPAVGEPAAIELEEPEPEADPAELDEPEADAPLDFLLPDDGPAPIALGGSEDDSEPVGPKDAVGDAMPIPLGGRVADSPPNDDNENDGNTGPAIALGGSTEAGTPAIAPPPTLDLGLDVGSASEPAEEEVEIETEIELPDTAGGAFDLVQQVDEAQSEQSEPENLTQLEQKLNELSELDDLSGALDVAKKILAMDPDHRVAKAAEGRSRDVLMKMASSKIGDLSAVPTVLCPPDQVIWLDLDHRSGFILSQVDGVSSYVDIMEIAGMDHLECALILAELVSGGVIGQA
ncbi:MAG: hypothetical protein AAFQ82_11680, partial [Myxococcota bacterium]